MPARNLPSTTCQCNDVGFRAGGRIDIGGSVAQDRRWNCQPRC